MRDCERPETVTVGQRIRELSIMTQNGSLAGTEKGREMRVTRYSATPTVTRYVIHFYRHGSVSTYFLLIDETTRIR
jgi:hypothetical protein